MLSRIEQFFPSLLWVAFFTLSLSVCAHAASKLPSGKRDIALVAADGVSKRIGSVVFTPKEDGAEISVSIDGADFQDEFLSMRPFRCLPDRKEVWCHLAYPYKLRGRVTASDLTDLEYALLFLFKPPGDYGINAWNGLYFKLSLGADGVISGAVHEVDLNVLAVPPEQDFARPVRAPDLNEVDPDSHRFARVEIK